jgi:MFS-type transporter involved in bile tolerance (Atg22 family)
MGAQESVMRALIGSMAPRARRGTAFGLFHAIFGIAWFIGSAALGFIYDRTVIGVAVFSLLSQIAAVPLLIAVVHQWPSRRAGL